ncbi:MAG: response regulator [Armatimonadota bacterium]
MVGAADGATKEDARVRLLLVDDEKEVLSILSEILEESGYTVVATWEGEDAIAIAELFKPDVLLTDFQLPGIDGVTTIRQIRHQIPRLRAILMSGTLNYATRRRAHHEQVEHVLEKPLDIPDLLQRLEKAVA